jgi:hypothetical protein
MDENAVLGELHVVIQASVSVPIEAVNSLRADRK